MPGRIFALEGNIKVYLLGEPPTVYRLGPHGEDASYRGPNIILVDKLPANMTHKQHAEEAAGRLKNGKLPASGAWTVIDQLLITEAPEVELGFIKCPYERTGTIRVYSEKPGDLHNDEGWAMGFVVDHPFFDEHGNVVFDSEGVPKGEYVFMGPLPLKSGNLRELPTATRDIIDILYGVKNAHIILPYYAYMTSYPKNMVSDNVRGSHLCSDSRRRRVSVLGSWRPSDSDVAVASRGAASGVLRCSMGEEEIRKIKVQRKRYGAGFKRNEALKGIFWRVE
jgi:hypothetical protein